jgi:hypothetical protein
MMGSCMRRLPFHPEDWIGPKNIMLTPQMAKHNRRVFTISNSKFDLTKGSGLSSDTDFAKVESTEQ